MQTCTDMEALRACISDFFVLDLLCVLYACSRLRSFFLSLLVGIVSSSLLSFYSLHTTCPIVSFDTHRVLYLSMTSAFISLYIHADFRAPVGRRERRRLIVVVGLRRKASNIDLDHSPLQISISEPAPMMTLPC